ncbi:EAL domain-containing protein [Phycicoccus sp. CSK15P-2]|uniref:bifunctional diguanylate cyclase/phosphodiesterase n=1 Tax=Phycicoccus sp. CSK15P-2 TaxID=2807627 RepID=UPI00194DF8A4|nr:EAL domain-containing protein [Phycicoccus sp. CSK15P-2]MBM6405265.1 EAL domain-containing protein [Phycicoccus sp. CSK15P-2]
MLRRTLGFAALFVLSIALGRLTVLPETGLAVFWPASGVAVLWMLRTRTTAEAALTAVFVGVTSALGNTVTGAPLVSGAILGLANVVVTVVTWWLLRRGMFGEGRHAIEGMRRLSGFYRFLAASAVGVALSDVVGMVAVGVAGNPVTWETALGWWMRNTSAVVVIAGPGLAFTGRREPLTRAQVRETVILLALTLATTLLTFAPSQSLPLAFVPLALVVTAGLRLPLPFANGVGALVAVAALILVRGASGGPFGSIVDAQERALVLQAFMMLSAVLAMVIATVRTQMWDVTDGLREARRRAENAVEDLRIVMESIPVGLFIIRRDGVVDMHNVAAAPWMHEPEDGLPTDEHVESSLVKMSLDGHPLPQERRPSTRALQGEVVLGSRIVSTDVEGRRRIVSIDAVPLHTRDDGAPDRAILLWQDVTEEHELVERLWVERARADRLIADAPHGIVVLDSEGRILQVNHALTTMFGRRESDLVGSPVSSLAPGRATDIMAYLKAAAAADGGLVDADWIVPGPSANDMHVSTSCRVIPERGGEVRFVVNIVDVSERRRYEDRLAYLADHDALTGLPNRRRFETVLEQHQAVCERYGPRGAVLVIDLDNFKEVNDTLGHAAGDHLITTIGRVLRNSVRASDVVARLGGDEFAVLLPEAGERDAEKVAGHLVTRVREHCATLDGPHRRVTASVGVVTFEAAAAQGGDAMALADMLMYDAKEAGRDGFAPLTREAHHHPRLGSRFEWRDRIEQAIERDLFEVHLQPILDLRVGRVTRAEALVRLRDGDSLVPPGHFVYVAELTGLAPALDAWVLARSVQMLSEIQKRDPDFSLEINVSATSIGHDMVEQALVRSLEEHGVAARTVILEVTETAAVQDIGSARAFAERLSALGTSFALDDFGAGFGSFYYLKHLVFDYVKIDGEFVSGAYRDPADRRLLRSIVDVARTLGKATVAEFVADDLDLELVQELQVDYAQGYAIGRPIPFDEFVQTFLSPPVAEAVPSGDG